MPMLSGEEVARVIQRWQDTDSEDWSRIIADYMPQGTEDKIARMVRKSEGTLMLPGLEGRITAAFMAGVELGWWLACAAEAKEKP